jgi:hypothetical protein
VVRFQRSVYLRNISVTNGTELHRKTDRIFDGKFSGKTEEHKTRKALRESGKESEWLFCWK